MPLDFPNSPASGDTYSYGDKIWEFDGTSWIVGQGANKIPSSAITDDKIASGAVTATKINNSAVSSTKIVNGSIDQSKCAANTSLFTLTTSSARSIDVPSPFTGQLIYETDTTRIKAWTGSTWLSISIL
jgi:hypothetical protein